jgi:hypothetical protein
VEQGFSPADSESSRDRALAPEVLPSAAKADLKGIPSTAGLKACATPTELKSRQGRQSIARHVSAGNSAVDGPESRRDGTSKDLEIFRAFVAAGRRLAEIHVHYEQQPEYKLEKIWKPGAKLDYRVTKMRLSKDKSTLFYNDALTLKGIPKETYDYRLGNRSALEWVVDQYQVSTDKRSGISNDPNRVEDKEYILRLIGQVITVSLQTVDIVNSLPEFAISESSAAAAMK